WRRLRHRPQVRRRLDGHRRVCHDLVGRLGPGRTEFRECIWSDRSCIPAIGLDRIADAISLASYAAATNPVSRRTWADVQSGAGNPSAGALADDLWLSRRAAVRALRTAPTVSLRPGAAAIS